MPTATKVGDRLERGETTGEPERRHLLRTAIWLGLTAVSLYLVAPSLLDVPGSWRDLERLAPLWLVAMAAPQALSLASLWALQRLAIRARRRRPIVTSQLAGNAMPKIAPGGGAVGAAVQYRMLVDTGMERARVVGGLTVANLPDLRARARDAGPGVDHDPANVVQVGATRPRGRSKPS